LIVIGEYASGEAARAGRDLLRVPFSKVSGEL